MASNFWSGAGSGALSGLGGLAGGVLSYFGQEDANETNAEIAAMNNMLALELANTAHQREVKDLVAAGLNPVLSVDGAGAPVPALTSARVENSLKDNGLQTAVNSAVSARSQALQQENLKTERSLMKAQLKGIEIDNAIKAAEGLDAAAESDAWRNQSYEERQRVIQLRKDAIEARAKDASNVNWRHNLEAANHTLNSAAGAAAATRGTKFNPSTTIRKFK